MRLTLTKFWFVPIFLLELCYCSYNLSHFFLSVLIQLFYIFIFTWKILQNHKVFFSFSHSLCISVYPFLELISSAFVNIGRKCVSSWQHATQYNIVERVKKKHGKRPSNRVIYVESSSQYKFVKRKMYCILIKFLRGFWANLMIKKAHIILRWILDE